MKKHSEILLYNIVDHMPKKHVVNILKEAFIDINKIDNTIAEECLKKYAYKNGVHI